MSSFIRFLACPLVAVLLALACPRLASGDATAHSPLGATAEEIAQRYGPILKHNARVWHHQVLEGGTVLDGDLHGKNGLVIRVVYHQAHVVLIEFTRATAPMSVADVNALLATCADDSTWEPGKDSTEKTKFFHRADGRAIGHWEVDDSSLLIASEGDNATSDLMDRLSQ